MKKGLKLRSMSSDAAPVEKEEATTALISRFFFAWLFHPQFRAISNNFVQSQEREAEGEQTGDGAGGGMLPAVNKSIMRSSSVSGLSLYLSCVSVCRRLSLCLFCAWCCRAARPQEAPGRQAAQPRRLGSAARRYLLISRCCLVLLSVLCSCCLVSVSFFALYPLRCLTVILPALSLSCPAGAQDIKNTQQRVEQVMRENKKLREQLDTCVCFPSPFGAFDGRNWSQIFFWFRFCDSGSLERVRELQNQLVERDRSIRALQDEVKASKMVRQFVLCPVLSCRLS